MNPIGASQGFPLTAHGRFEPRHLEEKEDAKLVIGPKGAAEAPKLTISEGAKDPAAKLGIGGEGAHAASHKLGPAAKDVASAKVDPRLEKVSREFEAIFMRNLLKPLEKAGSVGKEGSVSSGSGVYGSMMVGALADSASQGGGIGLAHLVLEALTRGATASKIEK
jgi:hypothetical protein